MVQCWIPVKFTGYYIKAVTLVWLWSSYRNVELEGHCSPLTSRNIVISQDPFHCRFSGHPVFWCLMERVAYSAPLQLYCGRRELEKLCFLTPKPQYLPHMLPLTITLEINDHICSLCSVISRLLDSQEVFIQLSLRLKKIKTKIRKPQ